MLHLRTQHHNLSTCFSIWVLESSLFFKLGALWMIRSTDNFNRWKEVIVANWEVFIDGISSQFTDPRTKWTPGIGFSILEELLWFGRLLFVLAKAGFENFTLKHTFQSSFSIWIKSLALISLLQSEGVKLNAFTSLCEF